MDKDIRDAFLDGTQEVFSILFTDGLNDGINLYLMDLEHTIPSPYGETKVKYYHKPVRLVSKMRSSMTERTVAIADLDIHEEPNFVVTAKDCILKNIPHETEEDFEYLRKSYIEYKGSFYKVDNVRLRGYVEDTFLFIVFVCEIDLDVHSLMVCEEPQEETAEVSVEESTQDEPQEE